MSTHNIGFYEDLTKIIFELSDFFAYFFIKTYVMGTHNIGFYEDLTKIIFELSSNTVKWKIFASSNFHGFLR